MNHTRTVIAFAGLVVMLILAALLWWSMNGMETSPIATSTPNATTTGPAAVSKIKIAVLDLEGNSNGKPRGCDKIIMVDYSIPTTTQPLTAAMQKLFSLGTTSVGTWYNFIERTADTLKFDRATVENGVAKIYLTGQLSDLAGVCDDPRAASQIEETALQFSTVQSVQLYLNGTSTSLIPSER